MAEIGSAFVSIVPETRGFGRSLTSQVGSESRTAGQTIGRTFGKMFALGAGVIAAAGVSNLLKGSIDEAREAQKVGAQTAAVIKSTGGVANVSATQFEKLAASISKKIGVDDEAIQAGENMLATFTNVRNEVGKGNNIFARATITASDMAAAFGGDAVSNSKILGKALNDPVKGVSALTRVGVTFTEKQKAQIKTMVESGKTLGAQKIILRELGKETKGSAEAQATAGDKASVSLGNLKETIGTALLPLVDRLAVTFTTKIAPALTTFITGMQKGTGAGGTFVSILTGIGSALLTVGGFLLTYKAPIGAFIAVLATWAAITKVITIAQVLLNVALTANPIGIVVVAIAALVAGLVYAYKNSEKFRAVVDKVFGFIGKYVPKIVGVVVGFVKDHWKLLVAIIGGPVAIVALLVVKHFGTIKKIVGAVASFVVDSAKKYGEFVVAVIDKVGKVLKFFKELPGKIKGFLTGLPGQLKTIGGNIIDGLVSGIKAAGQKVLDAVQAIINKIPKFIREKMGIASPSKVTNYLGQMIGQGLADGIAARGAKVSEATQKIVDKLKSQLDSVKGDFDSLRDSVSGAFTGNLFEATTASEFIANLTGTKGTLKGLMAAFGELVKDGWQPALLSQLFQSGNGGLILDLAAQDKKTSLQAASLLGGANSLSSQLGGSVADFQFGDKLDKIEKRLEAIQKNTHDGPERTGKVINRSARSGTRKALAFA